MYILPSVDFSSMSAGIRQGSHKGDGGNAKRKSALQRCEIMSKMLLCILLGVQGPAPSREVMSNSGRKVPATAGRNASEISYAK